MTHSRGFEGPWARLIGNTQTKRWCHRYAECTPGKPDSRVLFCITLSVRSSRTRGRSSLPPILYAEGPGSRLSSRHRPFLGCTRDEHNVCGAYLDPVLAWMLGGAVEPVSMAPRNRVGSPEGYVVENMMAVRPWRLGSLCSFVSHVAYHVDFASCAHDGRRSEFG